MTSLPLDQHIVRDPLPPPGDHPRRIDSVDLLRGLVMVLMLLDHTREYVHRDAPLFDAANLQRTTVALFFTRWVTHFCAPVFVLLAGAGASLQRLRGRSDAELVRFLVTRGLWLIVLELTVVRLGIGFTFDYRAFPGMLQVIWAIGVAMIVLAAFVRAPTALALGAGAAIVALHDLADGVRATAPAPGAPVSDPLGAAWMVLHQPGFIRVWGVSMFVVYPLLPWIGVMLLGYALGHLYGWPADRRQRLLERTGAAMLAAFVVLRAANFYGDPRPWIVHERGAVFTALSFIDVTKYPPSLLFVLLTLGPALIFLAWLERTRRGPVGRVLLTYGRVPLFFYLIQWFVAHGLGIGLSVAAGKPVSHLFRLPGSVPPAPGAGFGLGVTYTAWVAGLLLTYPLCRWFAEVKRRHDRWWLSYL
jgi:uncharacterized membrane protein